MQLSVAAKYDAIEEENEFKQSNHQMKANIWMHFRFFNFPGKK